MIFKNTILFGIVTIILALLQSCSSLPKCHSPQECRAYGKMWYDKGVWCHKTIKKWERLALGPMIPRLPQDECSVFREMTYFRHSCEYGYQPGCRKYQELKRIEVQGILHIFDTNPYHKRVNASLPATYNDVEKQPNIPPEWYSK